MSEDLVLEDVKKALGITGEYQDETLSFYIRDVKDYMRDAGVHETVINSQSSLGAIARGVCDLWNYGNGRFSSYFYQRVIQLSLRGEVENVQTEKQF